MAKLTTEELLAAFEELTLIELSEFIKAFEEKFDVTAAAPVAVAAAGGAAGRKASREGEQQHGAGGRHHRDERAADEPARAPAPERDHPQQRLHAAPLAVAATTRPSRRSRRRPANA